jgi:hypothetical protein
MTWKDVWEWAKFAAAVLGGMLIHAGTVIWRGGEKVGATAKQIQVFGEQIAKIETKVEDIPNIRSDLRAIKQALFDNGIEIRNGGH